jgi:hypothetical protein
MRTSAKLIRLFKESNSLQNAPLFRGFPRYDTHAACEQKDIKECRDFFYFIIIIRDIRVRGFPPTSHCCSAVATDRWDKGLGGGGTVGGSIDV